MKRVGVVGSALCVLLALTGMGPLAAPASAATVVAGLQRQPCPAMELIVVRGSGETSRDNHGFGQQWHAVAALLHDLRGVDVSYDQISYPAVGFLAGGPKYPRRYAASTAKGRSALRTAIARFVSGPCGSQTDIYLMGYSQGAHVVGDVYQGLSSGRRSHIGGVSLVGDPRFKGSQRFGIDVGTYSHRDNGIWDQAWARILGHGWKGRPRTWTRADASVVRSFCAKGDPICNATAGNIEGCLVHKRSCVHSHYATLKLGRRTYMQRMADWIAGRFRTQGGVTGPVANIRDTDFDNLTYPGQACLSDQPFTVVAGEGRTAANLDFYVETVQYVDVTGDGLSEAVVSGDCTNGGGTADGQLRFDYTIFTQTPLGLTALAVVGAYPSHPWVHVPLLATKPSGLGSHGLVRIQAPESLYGTADATCCPSLRATVSWTRHWGSFGHDPIVWKKTLYLLDGRGFGKARLGMTVRQLRRAYPGLSYYPPDGQTRCGTAYFGRVRDFDGEEITAGQAIFSHGRLAELDPWGDLTATTMSTGVYALVSNLKSAYGKRMHKVWNKTYQRHEMHVHLRDATLVFPIGHDEFGDPWVWVTAAPSLYRGHVDDPHWCG